MIILPEGVKSAFLVAGGLGLFLFGIRMLPEALKRLAGNSLRTILRKATKNPVIGLATGVAVTGIIQSSSATTVITVGFVNAGLMSLNQAIGIIYGANIGTTVTAQLMAFKISEFALPIIFVGVFLRIFAKKDSLVNFADILLGFGMLFFGMELMTQGVAPLKGVAENVFALFSKNPLLGVLAGMLATVVLQSSSATVGIVLALIRAGAITELSAAVPIILGDNIGTCITAILASIGTNLAARRTAAAHLGFNVFGTVIVLTMLPWYVQFVQFVSDFFNAGLERAAANAHTLFNICNALLFLPFTRLYTRLIELIMPGEIKIKENRAIHLDKNLLATPLIAFDAVDKEMVRALNLCKESLEIVRSHLDNVPNINLKVLKENEEIIDNLQLDITEFLASLSTKKLAEDDAEKIPKLLHSVNDIERIGDHGESLFFVLERKKNFKIEFPNESRIKLLEMLSEVRQLLEKTIRFIRREEDLSVKTAYVFENKINAMRDEFQAAYFSGVALNPSQLTGSMVYYDILINFEKMGDHLMNVVAAYNGILNLE